MEYTKGEWYVEKNKTWVYAYDPIVPVFIADCGQHGNAEANAHLISQAPRLYEALKKASVILHNTRRYESSEYRETLQQELKQIEQVLAKVEGK